MRLVYFARVREAIGTGAEDRDLPAGVGTIGECVTWLKTLGEGYATALAEPGRLRFALDQQMAGTGASLENATELAIFPPVTGG